MRFNRFLYLSQVGRFNRNKGFMGEINSIIQSNPYSLDFSSYGKWLDGKLIRIFAPEKSFSPLAEKVHDSFRSHVSNNGFPCIGAKAAINGNCYRFGFYSEMNTPAANSGLAHDLWAYAREQSEFATNYATFVVSFASPIVSDEKKWEDLLWAQLRSLHELDRIHNGWDPSVGSNPDEPDFSFSFAETGFFVVGLHPASSRLSRRFPWATLVFNVQAQFERLREQNLFERMQKTIRARDLQLQGSLNPNLSNFGEKSDARQYSGRAVNEDWKCPFHVQAQNTDEE